MKLILSQVKRRMSLVVIQRQPVRILAAKPRLNLQTSLKKSLALNLQAPAAKADRNL